MKKILLTAKYNAAEIRRFFRFRYAFEIASEYPDKNKNNAGLSGTISQKKRKIDGAGCFNNKI